MTTTDMILLTWRSVVMTFVTSVSYSEHDIGITPSIVSTLFARVIDQG